MVAPLIPLAIAAGASLLGGALGNRNANRAQQRAIEQAQFRPVDIQSPFGNIGISEGGINIQGGSPFQQQFEQFTGAGSQLLSGALGDRPDLTPQFDPSQGPGAFFTGLGTQAGQALQGFDPDAFATSQFERLNRLAAPGERTQTANAAQRLFGAGRLGGRDTAAGGVFGALDLSQRLGRDARLGQALGLAGTEQDRLTTQAGLFSQLGEQFTAGGTARDLGERQFQQGANQSDILQAIALSGAGQQSLAPLFQLLGQGTTLGLGQQATRAGVSSVFPQTAQQQNDIFGNLIGGFAEGIISNTGNAGAGATTAGTP